MFKAKLIFNEDSITETINHYLKPLYIRFGLLGLVCTLMIVFISWLSSGNQNDVTKRAILIISIVGIAGVCGVCVFRSLKIRKKYIQKMKEQIMTIYHSEDTQRDCEIKDELLLLYENDTVFRTLNIKDIMKLNITANYVSLIFKGNVLLNIAKDSIEGGTVEDLEKYINRIR